MSEPLRVEATRGAIVESLHRVSAAVVDATGRLVASAGHPELVTFWRSAAKPFQAMPWVAEGVADRYRYGPEELALACASHSSEPAHRGIAARMLAAIGLPESALACGPHVPLSPAIATEVVRSGVRMTALWSNCSGKHAGMLAWASASGWPVAGYERREHPLQQRVVREVERWTDVPVARMALGVDGCTVVSFGLPLRAMALAYARFAVSREPAAARLREAMALHPELTAGAGRLETVLARASEGRIIAKIGADGVYCVAIPSTGLGIALKIEDGDMPSLGPALLAILRELSDKRLLDSDPDRWPAEVRGYGELPILSTRGAPTGAVRAVGCLRFHA
jgi:L-asparaginase II